MNTYVSIKDLIAECIRKAWIIIAGVIIGAVALTAIKYIKDVKSIQSQIEETKNEVEVEHMLEALSESELNVLDYYIAQTKIYNQQHEYMEESIYFNLDANEMCVASVQYYLTAESKEKTDNIIMLYNNYLTYGGLWSDLCENNSEWLPEYLSEIIKFECADIADYNYPSVIHITVYQQDIEQARELVEQIKKVMTEFRAECSKVGLNHSLNIVDENILKTNDSNISRIQKDYINTHKTLGTELETLKESLSGNQLYLAELEFNADMEEEEGTPSLEETESDVKVSISKKYMLLGAILGVFASICIIAANYIFTSTIKMSDEMRILFQIPKFGTLILKEKNIFEKVADSIFYKNEINALDKEKELIISKISMLDMKELVFIGNLNESASSIIKEMREKLFKNGIQVKVVDEICNDAEDFEIAKRIGNVIFIETLRQSETKNIYHKMRLCEEQKINVLGYVILDI